MSSMIDYWSDLGATLGQGITNYSSASRLLEEQARARKIQEEDRARQMALQNLQFHQGEAQEARQGGNFAGAAALYQSTLKDRNDFDKGNRVGVKFIGTPTTAEGARPSDSFVGPMPPVTSLDSTRPDWKNQKNVDLLDAGIGYQAPKPELVKVGRSVGHYDANGKFVVDHTEPDPMAEYRTETLDLRRQQLADQAEARRQAAADRQEAAADRRANRTGPRTRTTTATIERDGKPVTVLINSETGDIIKEVGVKPTAKPKPTAPRPFDRVKADKVARIDAGIRKDAPIPEAKRAAYDASIKAQKREHEAEQRKARGEKSAADAFFEDLAK